MTAEFFFTDSKGVKQDFSLHYEKLIKPRIDEFEEKRLAALEKNRKRTTWMIIANCVFVPAVFFAVFSFGVKTDFLEILFATSGLSWLFTQWPIMKYKARIKETIYPLIFDFFGKKFIYESKIDKSILDSLESSGIIPHYSTATIDDYVEGKHEDVSLMLIDAILKSGSKKNKRTIFRGLFIAFSMNKKFAGKTVIRSESGAVGNWLKGVFSKLERVTLEDPNFEKIFEVYSDDQVEARYLLTTSFMERLVSLKDLLKGGVGNFQGSFYENQLLLTIPCEDKFKVGSIHTPVSFAEEIQTILKEMQIIFQIIDILKLNQKTGL